MRIGRLLGVVIVLQVLTLAGQWLDGGSQRYLTSTAQAQITDPGRDRSQMIDELKAMNGKLDRLVELLEGGKVQVRVVQPDEPKGKQVAR
jgi:hypothetical protein